MLNLSCHINRNPNVNDLIEANEIIKKSKNTDSKLVFLKLEKAYDLKLVIYTGNSYANHPDGVSSAGVFVIISGKDKKTKVLSWSSTKIKRVVAVAQKD